MRPRHQRRKLIDGQWYVPGPRGGWVVETSPQPGAPSSDQPVPVSQPTPPGWQPGTDTLPPLADEPPSPPVRRHRPLRWIIGGVIGLLVVVALSALGWYVQALRPVAADDQTRTRVTIASGATPTEIGQLLADKQVIRSPLAFDIYTRLGKTRNQLQAGTYSLQPSQSTGDIVDHLVSGKVDTFQITFFPGGTLHPDLATPETERTDVETMLLRAGFTQPDVDAALSQDYDHPLFANKPANADLEGYVYGETYTIDSSMTATQVLQLTFDEFYKNLTKYHLVADFKKHDLTLYQAITLASIVQREVDHVPSDQRQVAQIFYKRLADGMPLGADATFVYAAHRAGKTPSVDFDSPYNTRVHTGLPPGPIAAPGLGALQAVANPASGDYLYFVSGDDGTTHFARTLEQHEANTRQYCQKNCQLF